MSAPGKVMILGHSGFIGRHLVEYFHRHSPGRRLILHALPEMDLTRTDEAVRLAGEIDRDTVVVMLSGIKRQLGDSEDIFQRNMAMATNLARILSEHPAGRLVFISSAAVYGEEVHNTAITEETPVNPMSYYGIAKFASECIFRKLEREKGIPLVCLRPPLVYGPGDESRSYGPAGFIKTALEGGTITLWGEGDELREFLYVGDLARLLYEVAFSGFSGVLNAASGQSHDFREVLAAVEGAIGERVTVRSRPRTRRKVDNVFRADRLYAVVPGMTFTPLPDGVRLTVAAERDAQLHAGRG